MFPRLMGHQVGEQFTAIAKLADITNQMQIDLAMYQQSMDAKNILLCIICDSEAVCL